MPVRVVAAAVVADMPAAVAVVLGGVLALDMKVVVSSAVVSPHAVVDITTVVADTVVVEPASAAGGRHITRVHRSLDWGCYGNSRWYMVQLQRHSLDSSASWCGNKACDEE